MLQPLDHYTDRRKDDMGPFPHSTDSSCRHGYGKPVVAYWGSTCAYCGQELLEDYESWLHLSVDHVIPQCSSSKWGDAQKSWVESRANLVPSCRACNEFLNGYRVTGSEPESEEAFIALRNKALQEKREKALARHQWEKNQFQQLRALSPAESSLVVCDSRALAQRVMRSQLARLAPGVNLQI